MRLSTMRSKLPLWLFMLVLLAGFGLSGCEDNEDIQFQQSVNNRTPSAPVTFNFNQVVKIINVPNNVAKVTISGTDANNNAVSTSNPGFPVTLNYSNPLGPVFIPVIVRHIRVQFLDANNNLVGTGAADVQLATDTEVTVIILFDDGLPATNEGKLNGTYQMVAFGASTAAGVQPALTLRGPVVFDGAGHVSSANLQTYNFGAAPQPAVLSGTYTVSDDDHVTIHLQAGQSNIVVDDARLVEHNGVGALVSGTAALNSDAAQSFFTLVKPATGLTNAALNGNYAVGGFIQANFEGTKFSNFFGNFLLDGNGHVTGGNVTTQGLGSTLVANTGTYTVQNDGSFSLTYSTNLGTETAKGFIGTDGTLIFAVDPQGDAALVGQSFKTSTTFTNADLNGSHDFVGYTSFGTKHGEVTGTLEFDGAGNVTGGFVQYGDGVAHAVQPGSTYNVDTNMLDLDVHTEGGEILRVTFNIDPLSRATIGESFVAGSFLLTGDHGSGYFNLFLEPNVLQNM